MVDELVDLVDLAAEPRSEKASGARAPARGTLQRLTAVVCAFASTVLRSPPVSPVQEVIIIAQRELRKSFRSVKGILLCAFTVLGGGLLAYLLAQSEDIRRQQFANANIREAEVLEAKQTALGWWFTNSDTGNHVGHAPMLLTLLFAVSLWLVPGVVLLLGFDNVAGDLQHRTVRYWTIRTRRSSYAIGKFIGLWATCAVVALAMHIAIWIMVVARGEASVADTLGWGVRFWLASLPILSVWCAVSVFVSSLFRIPFLALLLTGGTFFLWWLAYVISWGSAHLDRETAQQMLVPDARPMMFAFPNFYDRFILSPAFSQTMIGLAATIGFAALCITGTSLVLQRRDV